MTSVQASPEDRTAPCPKCARVLLREPDGNWFCAHCATPGRLSSLFSVFDEGTSTVVFFFVAAIPLMLGFLSGWLWFSTLLRNLLDRAAGYTTFIVLAGLALEVGYAVAVALLLRRLLRKRKRWVSPLWVALVGVISSRGSFFSSGRTKRSH